MNGDNPLVSVLIPAYNHEQYIADTIKSIIDQTYKRIELIIIDDGSTDSTYRVMQSIKKECENRFEHVTFLTKSNEGTCTTFNKLFQLAHGEYVYIIASDDRAKPSAIEKEISFLQKNIEYSICVGDCELINAVDHVVYWDKSLNTTDSRNAKYKTFSDYFQKVSCVSFISPDFGTYRSLYKCNYIPNGYLIRRHYIDSYVLPFVSSAPFEDYYMMLQLSKYSKMKYIDEVLFEYRQHITNTVKNRHRMIEMEKQTRIYEDILLNNIDIAKIPTWNKADIETIKEYGIILKHIKLWYFFEYTKKQKGLKLITELNIFGYHKMIYKDLF